MTALDQRLYGWLIQSDERRFRLAFDSYFHLAFPAVVCHLSRVSRWDVAPLEDLAQDALLRFFERVGRGRRDAALCIQNTLPAITSTRLGPVHERRLHGWSVDVAAFVHAATHFEPPRADDSSEPEWRARVRSLADRIPQLQSAGRSLIEDAAVALRWRFDEPTASGSAIFVDRVSAELIAGSDRAVVAERSMPGLSRLAGGIVEIAAALPRLRLPTNAYLFEIATSLYLDECKRRARRKRGGVGIQAVSSHNGSSWPMVHADDSGRFLFDNPDTDLDSDSDSRFDDVSDLSFAAAVPPRRVAAAIDPTPQYEHEQLFEKFYEHLRRPVDEAVEAFTNADAESDARAARRTLESVTRKFSRTVSVLAMMGEGHTQEQTAQRLGLSRNQVKYILELVKKAYTHFVAPAEPAPARPTDGGAEPRAS